MNLFSNYFCLVLEFLERFGFFVNHRKRNRNHFLLLLQMFSSKLNYEILTKCEVNMTGYCPSSFFFFFLAPSWTETESRLINPQKKRTRPICSHRDGKSLVNRGFLMWLSGKFLSRYVAGSPERERQLYLAHSRSQPYNKQYYDYQVGSTVPS